MTVRLKPDTTAIDIAILPPHDVSERAVALSAALPSNESQGLRLGPELLPHVTLTQQFVSRDSLDAAIAEVDRVLRDQEPLHLRVTGGGTGSSSVWMSIERTTALTGLHERLMQAIEPFEVQDRDLPRRSDGVAKADASAFLGEEARDRDIRWVREFRKASSFARFTPHITLGHASRPPHVEPIDFVAARIALCHLGRFCTCRRIIRAWELTKG